MVRVCAAALSQHYQMTQYGCWTVVMGIKNWQITESSVFCEESTCHDSILDSDSAGNIKTLLIQHSNDTKISQI